jgi:hypothetical protein
MQKANHSADFRSQDNNNSLEPHYFRHFHSAPAADKVVKVHPPCVELV